MRKAAPRSSPMAAGLPNRRKAQQKQQRDQISLITGDTANEKNSLWHIGMYSHRISIVHRNIVYAVRNEWLAKKYPS
jgi:hypothetical protein